MSLVDKIAHSTEEASMPNHQFAAACWFWAKGDITRAQIINMFDLEASDEPQLDQLATFYQGLSAELKQEFYSRLHGAVCLLETDLITKMQFKTLLGMT